MTAVGQQRAIEGKQTQDFQTSLMCETMYECIMSNIPSHRHSALTRFQWLCAAPVDLWAVWCCSPPPSESIHALTLSLPSPAPETQKHTHKWKPNLPNGSKAKMTSTALLTSLIVLLISLFAVSRSSGRALFNNLANSWWHRDTF